jgi:hypothetical protein
MHVQLVQAVEVPMVEPLGSMSYNVTHDLMMEGSGESDGSVRSVWL